MVRGRGKRGRWRERDGRGKANQIDDRVEPISPKTEHARNKDRRDRKVINGGRRRKWWMRWSRGLVDTGGKRAGLAPCLSNMHVHSLIARQCRGSPTIVVGYLFRRPFPLKAERVCAVQLHRLDNRQRTAGVRSVT